MKVMYIVFQSQESIISTEQMKESILIIDFGSQVTKLIAEESEKLEFLVKLFHSMK